MLTCIFWNIQSDSSEKVDNKVAPRKISVERQKKILTVFQRLLRQYQVDVFLLAECPQSFVTTIIDALKEAGGDFNDLTGLLPNAKVRAIVRRSVTRLKLMRPDDFQDKDEPAFDDDIFDHHRLTRLRLLDPAGKDLLLLCAVHLVDKGNYNSTVQREEARGIARRIRYTEARILDRFHTIVVGDFNMDPFEEGMVLPDCFHSVPDRHTAGKHASLIKGGTTVKARTLQKRTYPLFFNPMWRLWGDGVKAPVGTYYYGNSWHMFDQLLIRYDAMPLFVEDKLKIISEIPISENAVTHCTSVLSLVNKDTGSLRPAQTKNKNKKSVYSDHFPLIFQIKD